MAEANPHKSFRDALGSFVTGIGIVTTSVPGNGPAGLTVNSFNAVSLDPPLVLWSLDRASDLAAVFDRASHFAVNLLAEGQEHLSRRFAERGTDRFAGLEVESGIESLPLIPEAIARFQCHVRDRYDGGDHVIYLGEVLEFDHRGGTPLVYFRSAYHRVAD